MTSTSAARAVRVDEAKNEIQEIPAVQPQPSTASMPTSELREVLNEAGKMLKAMSAGNDFEGDAPMGLLDSGASHPLRPGSEEEVNGCSSVQVTLAGDGTTTLAQNHLGTIVVPEREAKDIQPIVPLGALVMDLGCSLSWTRSSLKLTHPRHGNIRVAVKGKCPEVAISDALTLIRELEEEQLRRLSENVEMMSVRLQLLEDDEKRPWPELLKEFVKTGASRRFGRPSASARSPWTSRSKSRSCWLRAFILGVAKNIFGDFRFQGGSDEGWKRPRHGSSTSFQGTQQKEMILSRS